MDNNAIARLTISEADRAYCEAHQQAYAAMHDLLLTTKKLWCAAWQKQAQYLGQYEAGEYFGACYDKGVRPERIVEHLEALPYRFIHALAHHFEAEYLVEISEEDIQEQLYPKEPSPYHPEAEKTAYHTALQETVLQYEDILCNRTALSPAIIPSLSTVSRWLRWAGNGRTPTAIIGRCGGWKRRQVPVQSVLFIAIIFFSI